MRNVKRLDRVSVRPHPNGSDAKAVGGRVLLEDTHLDRVSRQGAWK